MVGHVGEYRPDGVLLGCSCGWEGADIEAHVRAVSLFEIDSYADADD